VSARHDAETRREIETLMRLGTRIARRLAASKGMLRYEDELRGVAWSALSEALAGYDPSKGALAPYAAEWMAGAVRGAIEKEQTRAGHEAPLADERPTHPILLGEELAADVVHLLLSVYVGDELGSNGEAELLTREAFAALNREIARLDADHQRLVALRYWEERTWEAVAAALGIDDRTARKWDVRIRERLRDGLIAWETVRPLKRGSR
jgi:RNA polymerase sigma factor (sigma-70 family)